nr:TetR/AcrR family transcriptional regulator [Patulibacter americanus]
MLDAAARVVGREGFARTTVADVVRAAGVSRSTFYAEFAGKEELFVQSYRHHGEVLAARIDAAVAAASGWREELRTGMEAYLGALAADPDLARAYLLEVPLAGAAALAARDATIAAYAERYRATFRHARREDPSLPEPPQDALRLLCFGTEQLAAERVRAGRTAALPELADVFVACAVALLRAGEDVPPAAATTSPVAATASPAVAAAGATPTPFTPRTDDEEQRRGPDLHP